jgi:hypothetical protein
MQYIFFWSERDAEGYLSNFYPSIFVVDGKTFNCSEQYFMKRKQELFDPTNLDLANKIMNETNPKEIKKYGRLVKNFNEKTWDLNKREAMYSGVLAKFSQNPELKVKLLATRNKILVEASPYDRIWGIGYAKYDALENKDKWGFNLLGLVLSDVRAKLKT